MDGFDQFKKVQQDKSSAALSNKQRTEDQLMALQTQETIIKSINYLVEYLDKKVTKTVVTNQLHSIGTPDALKVEKAVESLHSTLKTHKDTDLTPLTKVMGELLSEAKKIPKELPKQKDQQFVDYSKQLKSLEDAVKAVQKVVKEQKLIAEAPIVNVPETNVNVDAPDLKPLQQGFKDVVKAVRGVVIPEYKTDNKEVEKLLKKSNKLLKELVDKPVSKGGGGGQAWTAVNTAGIPMPLNLDVDGNLLTAGGGGGGNGAILDGADSAIKATVKDLTNSNPLTTALVDANGDQITSFGGGTQYTEGDTDASFTGTMGLVEGAANAAVTLKQPTTPADTQPISASALPLPTGAATAANQQTDALTDTQLRATAVPVSGTVTSNLGTLNGAATTAKQDTGNTSLASLDTKLPAQGQALAAASTPVVLPAAQITTLTPPAAITGFATSAKQDTIIGHVDGIEAAVDGIETLIGTTNSTLTTIDGRVDGLETLVTSTNTKLDTANTSLGTLDNAISGNEMQVDVVAPLPAGTNNIGDVDVLSLPALPAGTNAIGKLAANSGVDIGDVDVTSTVLPAGAATSSVTSEADSSSSVTLKSSNSARKEIIIQNTSSAILYVKYGTTATTSDFTVLLSQNDILIEDRYTGRIDGIWATDPGNGAAKVTEIT